MGKKTKSVNNKQSTGIDFIRAKKKVGRKIRKQANETNTEVKAKRINLSVQSVGAEGKGEQVTGRGLSMPELLNQCQHYSARVRKDALDGIQELLQNHPSSLIPCAATCVEKVAERLVDQEQIVRAAARGALKGGVLPALGTAGIAPFARRLVLHVGAALTHVAPAVRRDAPAVLESLLDAAPQLVGAHAPAATLRHLAELLRRGDDAASSSLVSGAGDGKIALVAGGISAKFGDMTAARVGPQAHQSRLSLLQSCRRFLEVLVGATTAALDFEGDELPMNAGATRHSHSAQYWRWGGDGDEDDGKENSRTKGARGAGGAGVALHAGRCARAPVSAARAVEDLFGVSGASSGGKRTAGGHSNDASVADGAEGVGTAAAELAALLFAVWDEATPTLTDAGGPSLTRVRAMAEAISCTHLCLRLVDTGTGGTGAAFAAALPHLTHRILPVFPAPAPAAAGDAGTRGALVQLNTATARILSAASDGAEKVAAAAAEDAARAHRALVAAGEIGSQGDDDAWMWNHAASVVDVDAADRATCAVADYLCSALGGVALDAGPCGEAEATREGDYGDLLRMARGVLLRSALVSRDGGGVDERGTEIGASEGEATDTEMDDDAPDAAGSRAALADSVGAVWSEAVVAGPPERRVACVGLLAAVLPRVAARSAGGDRSAVDAGTAAAWLRPFARLLWELKHGDPGTTNRALRTMHTVAARCVSGGGADGEDGEDESAPLAQALASVETELAPFFARVPPPPSDPTEPRKRGKPGPFSRLPPRCQHVAISLLGSLPTLSPTTLRAAAHAVLAPDAEPSLAVRATEAVSCNMGAAPLALSVSFLATLLTGSPCWATARVAAPAAARALVGIGDARSPWAGPSLAWPAANVAVTRAVNGGDVDGANRAKFGILVVAAVASEAAHAQKEVDAADEGGDAGSGSHPVSALAPAAESAVASWALECIRAEDDELRHASARFILSDPGWARVVLTCLGTRAASSIAAEQEIRCEVVAGVADDFAALIADVLPEARARLLRTAVRETMRGIEEAADAHVRDELPGSARAAKAVRAAKLALDGVIG